MTNLSGNTLGLRSKAKTTLSIPVNAFRNLPIPSIDGAKMGDCYVRVIDLPKELIEFMEVNPRIPNRSKRNDALTGPVVKSIKETLTESPEDMAIKNQGIYLLVDSVKTYKKTGNQELVDISLHDKSIHGIVNGGHTYHAIMDVIDKATEDERSKLSQAWVRLHILSGVQKKFVVEMAEGLNRSKQVDEASLYNLGNAFEAIKNRMEDEPGAEAISYSQGEKGEFYITHVLNILQMFNLDRFDKDNPPTRLYNSNVAGLKLFEADNRPYDKEHPKKSGNKNAIDTLISKLPDLLRLHDKIVLNIPEYAKEQGYEIGRMKVGGSRAGSAKNKNIKLHFLDEILGYRIPTGWSYPILSAFRANIKWDPSNKVFEWIVPLDELLDLTMPDLVKVILTAKTKDEKAPDKIGKDSAIYDSCYMIVQIAIMHRMNTAA